MPAAARRHALWFFAVMAVAVPLASYRFPNPFHNADVLFYLAIARGHTADVMQPFVARQLGPLVVRALSITLHLSVEHAFLVEGTLSLLLLLAFVFWRAARAAAPLWLLVALAVVPFWPLLFNCLALPDLWYAALLALLLLALHLNNLWLAAAMLFPLMLSRESTLLTLLCLLWAAHKQLRWTQTVTAIAATFAGSFVVSRLAAHSPGNTEKLSAPAYMFAKMPWNFLRNVAGLQPWSNVFPTLCPAGPRWQMALHFGPVRAVGICPGVSDFPLYVLLTALTTFGLLPLLLIFVWRRRRPQGTPPNLLLSFCIVYGCANFLLAPLLGTWIFRLFGYGWPLFLVAIPLLYADSPLATQYPRRAPLLACFALHLAACAMPYFQLHVQELPLLVAAYLLGWFMLRRSFPSPGIA